MPQPAVSKPTIAVDIDEVLVPFLEGFFRYHNEAFGTDYKITPGMPYFGAHTLMGYTVEQFQHKMDGFVGSDRYRHGDPIAGAREALTQLKNRYNLVIITSRPENVRELTESWIRHHFPETFAGVHFAEWIEDKPPDKGGVLRDTGATLLIDDNFNHIQEAVDEGLRAILFGEYPWNQHKKLPHGARRATSWAEVLELIG